MFGTRRCTHALVLGTVVSTRIPSLWAKVTFPEAQDTWEGVAYSHLIVSGIRGQIVNVPNTPMEGIEVEGWGGAQKRRVGISVTPTPADLGAMPRDVFLCQSSGGGCH
jgi:hypothetical protein